MSYQRRNHQFLYHAYALALGGYVEDKDHNVLPIQGVAPSVLSITGGFGSATQSDLNIGLRRKYPFGDAGPSDFHIYVGHAHTEVRGVEDDEDNPFGVYRTTVRSVLDDIRINDVFSVEHAEAVLMSVHEKPDVNNNSAEGVVTVGESNMSGVRVAGKRARLTKRDYIDRVPTFSLLQAQVQERQQELVTVGPQGKGGVADSWLDDLCDWHDPAEVPTGVGDYAYDVAKINQRSRNSNSLLRYSLFKSVDLPDTPGVKTFKSSIEVEGFGRIFLGEVFASHGMKQVSMFRIDLGCDNCGGVGGSGGSTNGGPTP
jgi:hypothetical protein